MKRIAALVWLLAQGSANAQSLAVGVHDVGIFSDLDPRLRMTLPALQRELHGVVDAARGNLVLYDGDFPVAIYPYPLRDGDKHVMPKRFVVLHDKRALPPGDLDDDGIPDPLDVALGAEKTALNADRYDGRYQEITYPNGDVPRELGVCTDVIIRAMRNAGFDLQRAVHEDIARAPSAYPMVKKANASIDHRRVKSLLPYFQRHLEAHSAKLDDANDPLRPGDVLFMDTFSDRPGAEHVGIVSARQAKNGMPLVINNWTNGTHTALMELLSFVPVTHRFRLPAQRAIPPWTSQLLVVTSDGWNSARGVLTRYERSDAGWRAVEEPIAVVLGHAGYAWGDGLHGRVTRKGPIKREGDGRSPAGIFALGPLRGDAAKVDSKLSYRQIDGSQVCVDDPGSRDYNLTVSHAAHGERMQRSDGMYALAIDVQHNRAPIVPGHGSCIFIHVAEPGAQLTGCTGLPHDDMLALTRWLSPDALLVALPRSEYTALRDSWALP